MSSTSRERISKALPAFHCILIGLAFSGAILRFFVTDRTDRYKCHSLLNEGEWLDAGRSSLERASLQNWQPDGCMLHSYNTKTAKQCLDGRTVLFIGDSEVRQLFYAVASLLDPSISMPDYSTIPTDEAANKHSDISLKTTAGASMEFVWDPYMNGTISSDLLLRHRGPESAAEGAQLPAMLVMGTGLWYLRHAAESGGIQSWTAAISQVFGATRPGQPAMADEVVLLPIPHLSSDKLTPDRQASMQNSDIALMNADLRSRLPSFTDSRIAGLSIPHVFNTMVDGEQGQYATLASQHTSDGLHYDSSIMATQANILLNLRCNDVLPKQFPFAKTCCTQYPAPNYVQALIIILVLVWAPIGTHLYMKQSALAYSPFFPASHVLAPLTIFSFSLVFLYFADRTSLFLKIQKQFDFWQFTIAMLAFLGLGVGTMTSGEKDLGFLNREQTDEWKGWMQIAILIYHYYGASKISGVYNPIRVLVASYLFMTGYGHFTFYYKKADFGLLRIASVLIRLNLLTVFLAYTMDTDYLSYYFSPLVTLWFIIIWMTMRILPSHNQSLPFILGKLALSAFLVNIFHSLEWPLKSLFAVFNTIFNTAWNAREWTFRVTLDSYIVYVGMLTALAYIKLNEMKPWDSHAEQWEKIKKVTIAGSALGLAGYFVFELRHNKFEYNVYHPYVSMVPVLSFIVLRNATSYLRSKNSRAFIWIGQCSLETFICQFHLWLAGDTKGILVLSPLSPRWRLCNMLFTTLIFLFVSNKVASATGELTDWLCGKKPKIAGGPAAKGLPQPVVTAKTESGANGGAQYIPLSQMDDSTPAENGAPAIAAVPADIPLQKPAPSRAEKILAYLPVRMALMLAVIWIINLLYPNAHPSQGHLLPTH